MRSAWFIEALASAWTMPAERYLPCCSGNVNRLLDLVFPAGL
jgi:hypothetical protein